MGASVDEDHTANLNEASEHPEREERRKNVRKKERKSDVTMWMRQSSQREQQEFKSAHVSCKQLSHRYGRNCDRWREVRRNSAGKRRVAWARWHTVAFSNSVSQSLPFFFPCSALSYYCRFDGKDCISQPPFSVSVCDSVSGGLPSRLLLSLTLPLFSLRLG